jgi:hypothetical protein
MDAKKVTNLARSFSASCKDVIKGKLPIQSFASPAVWLVSLTVVDLIARNPNKSSGWK